MAPEKAEAITGPVTEGIAKAGNGKTLADFDIAPYVRVAMGADPAACRDKIRPQLALYIGGMGARSKNYYNDLAKRFGYEAAAVEIQELYLAGRRKEAEAAVPDALIEETSLIGPPERIRDRLDAWPARSLCAPRSGQSPAQGAQECAADCDHLRRRHSRYRRLSCRDR